MGDTLSKVVVDLKAIDHNIRQFHRLLAPTTKFMAVVKGNAYGHGLFEVSKQALASGASYLGVVSASEAIQLRKWGIIQPIMMLGAADKEEVKELIKNKVGISIYNEESFRMVQRMSTILKKKAIVHIKVDTGLSRLGFANGDAVKVAQKIVKKPLNFELQGIYSHLASVEELNQSFTKTQIRTFERTLKKIKDLGIEIPIVSIAATGATIMHPESHFNCVRVGIGMYGLWPSRGLETWAKRNKATKFLKLKPALSYKTKLVHVRRISAGSHVGYGAEYQARNAMKIGVIPVGYYEGMPRSLSNMGFALHKSGKVFPMVGRVCMNMIILDVSKSARVKVGDEITLIGKAKNKDISATSLAEWASTINYEIVTRIPEHIERTYK